MSKFDAVIFDWAGTLIDFGSFAPMGVFVEAFKKYGVIATIEQAREPMGAPKRAHIKAMLNMPRIKSQWVELKGHEPGEDDIDAVYATFVPMNEEVAPKFADMVPGAMDTISWVRARGLKVGTTTGYTRSIMAGVLPVAEKQGFVPECVVCADDVVGGRPGPEQIMRALDLIDVSDPTRVIKVDDTEPGLAEGVAVGAVTVGLALSGNIAGKTPAELAAMPADDLAALRERATEQLKAGGAQYVIDTVADLPALIEKLDA